MRPKAVWIAVAFLLVALAVWGIFHALAGPGIPSPQRPVATTESAPAMEKAPPEIPSPAHATLSTAPAADYAPPKTTDSKLAALVDRRAPENARISSDIGARLPSVEHPEDFPALIQVLGDAQDDDTVRNEVANLLRRSHFYAGTADSLIGVLNNPAEKARFRSFAVQHLYGCLTDNAGFTPAPTSNPPQDPGHGAPPPKPNPYALPADEQQKITDHLHTYLTDRDVEVRRESLLALVRLKDPVAAPTAVTWLNEPGPEADRSRDLAIRCVHDLALHDQTAKIRQYVRDPNEVIRIAAIVALSDWNDQESRAAFEEAAQSNIERLQRAGKAALARLKTETK